MLDSSRNNLLQSGCTILLSHQQWIWVPVSLYPHHHLFLFIIDILVGKKLHLIIVLICISLLTYDIEYFFMSSLTICIPSSVKCLIISFSHFLISHFVLFILLMCKRLLSDVCLLLLYHSLFCLFIFHFTFSVRPSVAIICTVAISLQLAITICFLIFY